MNSLELRNRFLFAAGAEARKPQADAGNLIAADIGRLLCNFVGDVDLKQVPNSAAASADQMGVGGDIGVEMFLPIDDAYRLNQPRVLELGEIPIDCAQTEIGIVSVELVVDPICSGVGSGAGEAIVNCLTLFTESLNHCSSFQ